MAELLELELELEKFFFFFFFVFFVELLQEKVILENEEFSELESSLFFDFVDVLLNSLVFLLEVLRKE
jgi:hypothetical protein